MSDQIVDMLAAVQGRTISEVDLRRLTDEVARLRTELQLDRNRFLLIKSLVDKDDYRGAVMTCDVALNRLAKVIGPPPAPRDDR